MARSLALVSRAATLSMLAHSATALAVDCFVDSVAGSDTNNGSSEAAALQSPTKVPSTCTVIRFKRGSEFKLASGVKNLGIPSMNGYTSTVATLTNYGDESKPLPKFVKDHVDGSGAIVEAFGAITIDGLYMAGSKSANDMGQLGDGICVRLLGAGSKLLNSEITLCDIGVMTSADNVQVLNNYIHDLSISVDAPPGVDPNAVGGAEGIFVNSSHVEVAYNRFINCSTAAQWVTNTNGGGVRCDGGATEVTVPNGKNGAAGLVTDVRIHHNFSYNSCGFFEVSSMFQQGSTTYVKGEFTDSIFHDNVMVDSGWISLLQVNNTRLKNVTWANNTIVHHDRGSITDANGTKIDLNDFGSSAIQVIAFNSTSSGATGGGEISPGDIFWKNNLWYFDPKVKPYSPHSSTSTSSDALVKNIQVTGDVVLTSDPGFIDITSTTDPTAYDLKSTATSVIDQGAPVTEITTDFRDRPRPSGSAFDLGAFEFQSNAGGATAASSAGTGGARTTTVTAGAGRAGAIGGATSSGGAKASGVPGGTSSSTGSITPSSGGTISSASSAIATIVSKASGGSPASTPPTTTSTPPIGSGGGNAVGGNTAAETLGQSGAGVTVGGQSGSGSNSAPTSTTNANTTAGSATPAINNASGGAPTQGTSAGVEDAACSCIVTGRRPTTRGIALGLLLLSAALRRRSRARYLA
jgi:hypothetical protein